jgi:hypothetical protein
VFGSEREPQTITERMTLIDEILKLLDSGTNEGFLIKGDLTNFPIFSDFLTPFRYNNEERK